MSKTRLGASKHLSNSAKPSDILTWSVSLGPLGKEIRVFEVSFSERNLRKALNAIYEEDYKASSGGKAFLKKAVPVVQQDLKSAGQNFSEATIQDYFLKQLPDTAARFLRLWERLARRDVAPDRQPVLRYAARLWGSGGRQAVTRTARYQRPSFSTPLGRG